MIPFGSIVNALSVIGGSLIGLSFGNLLPKPIRSIIFEVMGVFTLVLGLKMSLETQEFIVLLLSLTMGAAIGEKLNIENTVDTLALARDKFPGSPVSLDALCKRYRIDNSNRTQHTALIDCDLLAKVYINLLDQKEPTLNFKNDDNEKTVTSSNNKNQYYKKIIKPSEEELRQHKEYLKSSLKKNFFN